MLLKSGSLVDVISVKTVQSLKSDISELQQSNTALSDELQSLKNAATREEVCEKDLNRLRQEYSDADLVVFQDRRSRCSAERLASFDNSFPRVKAKLQVLEAAAEAERAAERREKEKREAEKRKEQEKREAEEQKAKELEAVRRRAKWRSHVSTSKIQDTRDVYLRVDSDTYQQRFGRGTATLAVRCVENTTAFVINFGEYLGDDSSSVYEKWKRVTIRLDDQNPIVKRMDVATNNEAVGLWSGGASIPFIKSMIGKKRMVVRITPYGENTREMTFPIEGLEYFIDPLRESCNW